MVWKLPCFLKLLDSWGDFFDNDLLLYPVSDHTMQCCTRKPNWSLKVVLHPWNFGELSVNYSQLFSFFGNLEQLLTTVGPWQQESKYIQLSKNELDWLFHGKRLNRWGGATPSSRMIFFIGPMCTWIHWESHFSWLKNKWNSCLLSLTPPVICQCSS